MKTRLALAAASAALLAACGGSDEPAASTPDPQTDPIATTSAGEPAVAPVEDEAEPVTQPVATDDETDTPDAAGGDGQAEASAILASLGAAYLDADIENGRRRFRLCQSCHTLEEGGRSMVGPNLYGVFGSEAGAGDFTYSRQLSESGIVWDAETMDAWLANPRQYIPGNRMSFVGLRNEEDRRDVIAYLALETGYTPDAAE